VSKKQLVTSRRDLSFHEEWLELSAEGLLLK